METKPWYEKDNIYKIDPVDQAPGFVKINVLSRSAR